MVNIPPIIRRFPSSLLLALSLLTFVASVLIFTLPFEVKDVGATNATASCGPPVFEIAASEYAAPSTIVPPGTTVALGPLAQLPASTSTTAPPGFGVPITTPGSSTTAAAAVASISSTNSTLDLKLVQEACGGPASQRFLFGGLGIVIALLIGYLARLRRAHKFGYVIR